MNSIVRVPRGGAPMVSQQAMPQPTWAGGQPQGWWGGPCCPDDSVPPFPCPPPGFPPPGCPPWFSGMNSPPWYPGANAGVSFGQTPPPNPVRGHFWFDGTVLWMFDGAAWTTVGGNSAASGGSSVAVGSNPPPAPQVGALWFDGADLLLWTGTAWIHATGAASGSSPPSNPTDGMLWFNGSTLMVWDGTAWVPVSQTKSYIQATAPPNPNPGDTWWNGSQMRIWDGTAWNLVGPGATVGPVGTTAEAFALTENANQAIGAWSIVTFNAVPTIDLYNGWNAGNHIWKPQQAGIYQCTVRCWYSLATQLEPGIALMKNDSGSYPTGTYVAAASVYVGGTAGTQGIMQATGMTRMNGTTDYVRVWGNTINTVAIGMPNFETWIMP